MRRGRRAIDETLTAHFSSIGDGGENVFALKLRVIFENFLDGGSGGKEVE